MCTTPTTLITQLTTIMETTDCPLRHAVVKEILDHARSDEEARSFLSDILHHGCVSGMIPSLVYYVDTHVFYDTHYAAIEALREEYEESTEEPIQMKGDLKNFLAWFAFEATVYQIAGELELT